MQPSPFDAINFAEDGNRSQDGDSRLTARLVKRLVAQELTLSFVPDAEQRLWRTVMRRKYEITRTRVPTLCASTRSTYCSSVTNSFFSAAFRSCPLAGARFSSASPITGADQARGSKTTPRRLRRKARTRPICLAVAGDTWVRVRLRSSFIGVERAGLRSTRAR